MARTRKRGRAKDTRTGAQKAYDRVQAAAYGAAADDRGVRRATGPITAKYPGRCVRCGKKFIPEVSLIVADRQGAWRHYDGCTSSRPKREYDPAKLLEKSG